jgi:F-box/leucine-rich repeat protein 14
MEPPHPCFRCSSLTGVGLAPLSKLPVLCTLSLLECEITDLGLLAVSQLGGLTRLNLDYCQRISDDGLAAVAGMPQLQTLSLSGCEGLK